MAAEAPKTLEVPRDLTLEETGEFRTLYAPPTHLNHTEKGATAESLSGLVVESVPPTWRDLWAILRNRYQPRLRVRFTTNGEVFTFHLKRVWNRDALENQLYADSPLLNFDRFREESA